MSKGFDENCRCFQGFPATNNKANFCSSYAFQVSRFKHRCLFVLPMQTLMPYSILVYSHRVESGEKTTSTTRRQRQKEYKYSERQCNLGDLHNSAALPWLPVTSKLCRAGWGCWNPNREGGRAELLPQTFLHRLITT